MKQAIHARLGILEKTKALTYLSIPMIGGDFREMIEGPWSSVSMTDLIASKLMPYPRWV